MKKHALVPESQTNTKANAPAMPTFGLKSETIKALLESEKDLDEATIIHLLETDPTFREKMLLLSIGTDDQFLKEYIEVNNIPEMDVEIDFRKIARETEKKLNEKQE